MTTDTSYFFIEEVRLGLDSSKPVAVQQWSSLIAGNEQSKSSRQKEYLFNKRYPFFTTGS